MPNPARPETKNDRRRAARLRARAAMEAQRRRAQRQRVILWSSVVVGLVAIVTVVAVVLVMSVKPPVPGPRNLAADGITIGKGFTAERSSALVSGDDGAIPTVPKGDAVQVRLYSDYLCPNCRQFEEQYGDYLEGLVKSGAISIQYHPIAILDRLSQGTNYSTRSTAAALCVADLAPDSFFAVNKKLFAEQPEENTAGLSTSALRVLVTGVEGMTSKKVVGDCIDDQRFASWSTEITQRASDNVTKGSDSKQFRGTPTVVVDGVEWTGSTTLQQTITAASEKRTK